MIPEEIVQQTLNNTTHFYLSVEEDNQHDPRRHYIWKLPGLIYPRQRDTVAYETFLPTAKSSRGNSFSQLFMGTISDRWSVYHVGKEIKNGTALRDYLRQVGFSPVIKTFNTQSELKKMDRSLQTSLYITNHHRKPFSMGKS